MLANSFLFGERIPKKDPTAPNDKGWKPLYNERCNPPKLSDDTLLGKKSVIFLSGGGALTEASTNGCCKSAQGMLRLAGMAEQDMPHLYGFGYVGKGHRYHRNKIVTHLKQAQFGSEYTQTETNKAPAYYQHFFDEYIQPLFVNEQGQARPLMEIKRNLQNITFVSYCQGGFLAWQIEKMMIDKLTQIYPEYVQQVMNNVRMIHFASQRPKGQKISAKHLDVILQEDEVFSNDSLLEYDNIHQQMQRLPLPESTALIPISQNEEILFLKRITTELPNKHDKYLNHTQILQLFSGEYQNTIPENEPALRIVRQLLRHFVEHPQDKKSVEEQLTALNPDFVKKNTPWSQNVLAKEQENGKMRRGLLSLITNWGANLGHKQKKRHSGNNQSFSTDNMLRQHDDQGRFLYDELKKRYQQNHDHLSLINYLKTTHAEIPPEERGHLALLAIKNRDWKLLENLGKKDATMLYVKPDQLQKIIFATQPEDLYRVLPLLKNNMLCLREQPYTLALLMRKTKKIKKVIHKKMLESFFNRQLESCFYAQKETFKSLLGLASLNEKKNIKMILQERRQKKARELFQLKQERDTLAPDLLIQEYGTFQDARRKCDQATLDDFRQFKSFQKTDKNLTFNAFIANKYRSR